ncbi:LytTR family DNA-binding domain-containing protein [Staphylococcus hominis]|uniref:LytTR family DNA-binding domain-containing protein n=1 Tax=Staphylococcus hominis TaxID=1290 RepID=UPI00098AC55A|nr:LytTR family DNA-binding domain-containing protein [Staphylococcus hominis]TBW87971.1 response regulator transcription factor [Staphylococcus hominis]TBW90985.1 response regulator transcription factor [Staphylococcus hominis]UNQ68030.1 LytTR family DNA-binding domain-containing protein [Staphylococcus hominis]
MKIEINIDKEAEEKITISAKQMTTVLSDFLKDTEKRFNKPQLNGKLGDHVYPIDLEQIAQFIVEDKQVYAITMNNKALKLDQRLYQIEELVGSIFVRISKSEIINLDYIDHLKLETNGMVHLTMKNGNTTYASRRYLKTIKERLSL